MKINFSYVLAFLFALVIVVLFLVSLNREADESEYANLAELAKDSKSKKFCQCHGENQRCNGGQSAQ